MTDKLSKTELIEDIQRVHDEHDKLTVQLYREHGNHAASTVINHFGSWNDAVEEAGIKPNTNEPTAKEDIIEDIRRVHDEHGKISARLYTKHGKWDDPTVQAKFGSWNAAVEAAGLTPNPHKSRIPGDDLLADLLRVAGDLSQDTVSQSQYTEHGAYDISVFYNRFDSWTAALEVAGLNPNKRISDKELLADLRRVADDLDKETITSHEYREHGEYSLQPIYHNDRFGSWTAALEAAGLGEENTVE